MVSAVTWTHSSVADTIGVSVLQMIIKLVPMNRSAQTLRFIDVLHLPFDVYS